MSQNDATGLGGISTTGETTPRVTGSTGIGNTKEENKKKILKAKKQISEAKIKISEAQSQLLEAQAKLVGANANNLVVSLSDLAVKIIIGISKFDNLFKKIQKVNDVVNNEEQDTLLGNQVGLVFSENPRGLST
jgi:hypothetical protein